MLHTWTRCPCLGHHCMVKDVSSWSWNHRRWAFLEFHNFPVLAMLKALLYLHAIGVKIVLLYLVTRMVPNCFGRAQKLDRYFEYHMVQGGVRYFLRPSKPAKLFSMKGKTTFAARRIKAERRSGFLQKWPFALFVSSGRSLGYTSFNVAVHCYLKDKMFGSL